MPELNREDIIKGLEGWLKTFNGDVERFMLIANALTLIKQLIEENESLGIENEVQRLNLGNTRDDLNNAECDVARLKRENTALEREVERLKADAVPRREVERLQTEKASLEIEIIDLKNDRDYWKAETKEAREDLSESTKEAVRQVAREIFEEIEREFSPVCAYAGYAIKEYLADIKKKYIGE